ncbi:MAG: MoaD/ThiS family protein [Planctomycetota bacterium]|nr:MoaD/ThiS family protein [Planctomycetota bacterium]
MSVQVQIPTPLYPDAGGQAVVEVIASTVGESLAKLIEIHPAMGSKLFENGKVRRFVNIFVNREDIRYLENLATPVKEGDEIGIIPAVAGG